MPVILLFSAFGSLSLMDLFFFTIFYGISSTLDPDEIPILSIF
jgi:hypothetical protein